MGNLLEKRGMLLQGEGDKGLEGEEAVFGPVKSLIKLGIN